MTVRQITRSDLDDLDEEEREEWAREATLDEAITHSRHILSTVTGLVEETWERTATVGLFSGGNDSSAFMHLFRDSFDAAAHINTGIGVEETRLYVRKVCADFGLDLIEEEPPPGCTYPELVMRFGFPGPGGHMLMFSRLKERGLRNVRRRFVVHPRRQRVLFVAGMRHFESDRRMANTEETHPEGSIQWVSPLAWWTNDHMREYRERFDVPRNEVSDNLHMSGECLCGAFAKPGELEELRFWYPETAAYIDRLQVIAREAGVHCVWGTRPPKKPKGARGPTWICFCDGVNHVAPDDCPDGTWWANTARPKDSGEVGLLCRKCEIPA